MSTGFDERRVGVDKNSVLLVSSLTADAVRLTYQSNPIDGSVPLESALGFAVAPGAPVAAVAEAGEEYIAYVERCGFTPELESGEPLSATLDALRAASSG